jgi:hypothetical protein
MPSSDAHAAEREKWRNFPRVRPPNIIVPGSGQESVWDYPRPPRVEAVPHRVRVEFAGIALADTTGALRVCETSSPPVYYITPADIRMDRLEPGARRSFCEWKGGGVVLRRVGDSESRRTLQGGAGLRGVVAHSPRTSPKRDQRLDRSVRILATASTGTATNAAETPQRNHQKSTPSSTATGAR